jgi:predicted SAM-dependent methyltransferase
MPRTISVIAQRLGLYKLAIRAVQRIEILQRPRKIRSYFANNPVRKLQIGAGTNLLEGWLNTEWVISEQQLRIPTLTFLDALKPYPFETGSFDYIYSEHVIEHFAFIDGAMMIAETFRVLKPGGRMRIVTPDLEFLIKLYSPEKSAIQTRYIKHMTDAFHPELSDRGLYDDVYMINNYVRDWGHRFIYDKKSLEQLLRTTGFDQITSHEVSRSNDTNLQNIEVRAKTPEADLNELESMVFEAVKPIRAR